MTPAADPSAMPFEELELGRDERREPRLHGVGARARHFDAAAQPASESALARASGKSRPAWCICASALPSAAQCMVCGRRTHIPSRKVTMHGGPASATAAALPRRGP